MRENKIPYFPFAGNEQRYEKWEKEPLTVLNSLQKAEEEMGFQFPEPLQKINKKEITPKEAVDIDSLPLTRPDCPNIVMGRPHAGEFIPEDLWQSATEEGKITLSMIDRGTEKIFRSAKIPSVGTKISRFIIDPNRPPLPNSKTPGSQAPGEVMWKTGITGKEMYQIGKQPTDEAITDLSERFYLPYYNAMMGNIGQLADRRKEKGERILVLDGHSFMTSKNEIFKPICQHYGIKDLQELPLFIIGDKDGLSCDRDIRDAFQKNLEENFKALKKEEQELLLRNSLSQRIVGVNEFMKGVRNVEFYGQRAEGINSIQLETSEGMHVDEVNNDYFNASYNERGLALVQQLLEKTCLDLDPLLKNGRKD